MTAEPARQRRPLFAKRERLLMASRRTPADAWMADHDAVVQKNSRRGFELLVRSFVTTPKPEPSSIHNPKYSP